MLLLLAEPDEESEGEWMLMMEEGLWSALPLNLLLAILARLPFSSFVRFRAVCKQWNTILHNPSSSSFFSSPPTFYNQHWTIFKINNPPSLDFRVPLQPSICRPHGHKEEGDRIPLRWHRINLDFLLPYDCFMSSHAGLVLVRRSPTCYLVCNPLLRVSTELPVPPIYSHFAPQPIFGVIKIVAAIFGGMKPTSTSFKVICAQWFVSPGISAVSSFLYDSESRQWKNLGPFPFVNKFLLETHGIGTLCKKIYYWPSLDFDLLAFDFERETWHIFETKQLPFVPISYTLWEWQDHLMMIVLDIGQMTIWQLSEENSQWVQFDKLTCDTFSTIDVGLVGFHCTCVGNILMFVNSVKDKVVAYNIFSKALTISDVAWDSSLICESFLSFHPRLEEAQWS